MPLQRGHCQKMLKRGEGARFRRPASPADSEAEPDTVPDTEWSPSEPEGQHSDSEWSDEGFFMEDSAEDDPDSADKGNTVQAVETRHERRSHRRSAQEEEERRLGRIRAVEAKLDGHHKSKASRGVYKVNGPAPRTVRKKKKDYLESVKSLDLPQALIDQEIAKIESQGRSTAKSDQTSQLSQPTSVAAKAEVPRRC